MLVDILSASLSLILMDGVIQFLHLLAATVWIGGAVFMNFVFSPVLKKLDFAQRGLLVKNVSGKFSLFAWPSVAILLITGFIKLPEGLLGNFTGHYGAILHVKLLLVFIMIALGLYLTVYLGSKVKKISPDQQNSAELLKLQKVMPVLSMSITLLGVVVLLLISFV